MYEDALLGRVRVTESGGKLRLDAGPALGAEMDHWQYDRFRARYDDRWQGTEMITFMIGDGVANALEIGGFTLKRVQGAGATAAH